jgi:Uma2 family endonuclease
MTTQPTPYITPEEYITLERDAKTKSEYFDGRIFAMAGASEAHVLIATNLILSLGAQLRDKRCRVYAADMRVKVTSAGLYTYPDIAVICGKAQFEDQRRDTLLNPTVLFEIASPSTEAYDRGQKFAFYRELESMTDYVVVSQAIALIDHFTRLPDGKWLLAGHRGLETVAHIDSIGCDLPLTDVYDKVEFPEPGAEVMLRRIKEEDALYAAARPGAYYRPASPAPAPAPARP